MQSPVKCFLIESLVNAGNGYPGPLVVRHKKGINKDKGI